MAITIEARKIYQLRKVNTNSKHVKMGRTKFVMSTVITIAMGTGSSSISHEALHLRVTRRLTIIAETSNSSSISNSKQDIRMLSVPEASREFLVVIMGSM